MFNVADESGHKARATITCLLKIMTSTVGLYTLKAIPITVLGIPRSWYVCFSALIGIVRR